jgi:integrase
MGPIARPRIETPARLHVLVTGVYSGRVFTAERPIRVQIDGRCKRVEEDGMAKAHAVRLDDETTEWLERYAEERGTDKGAVLRSAVAAFREDVERGVPDLKPEAKPQGPTAAQRRARAAAEVYGVSTATDLLAERQRALNKKIQGWS